MTISLEQNTIIIFASEFSAIDVQLSEKLRDEIFLQSTTP
jgi:hypothetical protein